ncbi:delta-1-pyrroline-5-carboxylate dehydrogenase [Gloeomargarita lithophora Alchichica-D10]|uniref:L-glutamate gamma-semialdehyde dehydrogenase n=1 Tax=Gloeomargarita lithophora Alchichica-D10 TaxID=1188229 RepID=A0A1J0AAA8_9CYAN|nr:proline dehydrogenase family protein [Gloeomargarita lithophora]APB32863.1 delta-1-pyrroline-5-carboxylate dehydrogenase [Gloeomargarita lithophora Alchichica-D10]
MSLESRTQTIGQTLLAATHPGRSFLAQMREPWDEKLLAWTMEHPGLRTQMFRLIDTLPFLSGSGEISRHIQEYLHQPGVELPGMLKNLLNFTGRESLTAQVAAQTLTTAVSTLARKYIVGENFSQVRQTLERLGRQGMTFTLDILGEAVLSESEAQGYFQKYIDLMTQLAPVDWGCVPQVSVKLSAFYSQFDPLAEKTTRTQVTQAITQLLQRAGELGVAVHFDMEQYKYKNITLAILKDVLLSDEFRSRTDVGLTVQAYLQESEADVREILAWVKLRGVPVTLRLVKGAYWDQEVILAQQKHWPLPVYRRKSSTDANYEKLTRLLLENHPFIYPAIGSHNVRSQAHALAIAEELSISPNAWESQVLYGMAAGLAKALVAQGQPVRMYCPYGELLPGMSYLIRRLLENTANTSFLRQRLEKENELELLTPPQWAEPTTPLPQGETFMGTADTNFAQMGTADEFLQAIVRVKLQLGHSYFLPHCSRERTLDSVNPSDPKESIGRVGLADISSVQKAMDCAQEAQKIWGSTPIAIRVNLLQQIADTLQMQRSEWVAWMVLEVGKPIREADAEVSEAIDFCRYYSEMAEGLHPGYTYDVLGETNRYVYQPKGIGVVIAPWNYPLAISVGMITAGLVTGNCVLYKPAEQSAVIGCKISELISNLISDLGLPQGVFQGLPGWGEEIGPELVRHPAVHFITFTGSRQVGCQIYAQAAQMSPGQRHLKRVVAEMGGKNAIIVDASADLDQAVQGVVQSAFGYAGQKCSACARVIVLAAIYEPFLERLRTATQSLTIGCATDPATTIGPVIDATAQERLQKNITLAKQRLTVALESAAPTSGYFVGPVIFTDVPPDDPLAQEELFGPVLAVLRVADFDQALQVANGTDYALTGGLYSRTPSHIHRAMQEYICGNLYINRGITGALVGRQPFGGFRCSGVGSKAGGPDYLLQFVEPKVVTENIQRQGFAPVAEEL